MKFLFTLAPLLSLALAQGLPKSCSTALTSNTCNIWDTSAGSNNSFTIHGLWPDNCYDAYCDTSREVADIASVLANSKNPTALTTLKYMNQYWLGNNGSNNEFWSHEFNKHGTCISTLRPTCYGPQYFDKEDVVDYFETTVNLFKALPTFQWLQAEKISPSNSTTYTLNQLQAVAQKYTDGYNAIWNCKNDTLTEVWWFFNTIGGFGPKNQDFYYANAIGKSSCPETGIRYPIKTIQKA